MNSVDFTEIAREVYTVASSSGTDPLSSLVKEALDVIDDALDSFRPEHVSLSFNGGKDCTVLLHLLVASLGRRGTLAVRPIPAVYIPVPSPFSQLEDFINDTAVKYNLDLFQCPLGEPELPVETVTGPATPGPTATNGISDGAGGAVKMKAKGGEGMKRALEAYKEKFPHIEAILIGTRRSDPHGAALTFRNPTDPGWPAFERVNPIINWSYSAVWDYLRRFRVPYCSLYDEGYTSLGSTYNTFRNPALLIQPSCGSCSVHSWLGRRPSSGPTLPSSTTPVPTAPTDPDNMHPHALAPYTPDTLPARFEVIPTDPLTQCIADGTGCDPLPDVLEMIQGDPQNACYHNAGRDFAHAAITAVNGVRPSRGHFNALPDAKILELVDGVPGLYCVGDDGVCQCRYRPAYELVDGSLERAGRAGGATAFKT